MNIRQRFAKAALSYLPDDSKKTVNEFDLGINTFLVTAMSALIGIGVMSGNVGQPGSENADKIADDYERVLEQLIEEKASLIELNQNNINDNSSQSYISQYINGNPVAESELTVAEKEINSEQQDEFLTLVKAFADNIQRDPNLAEDDAGDIIGNFESEIITLKELGYEYSTNSNLLRECQALHATSLDINACTLNDEPVDLNTDSAKATDWFATVLLGLLVYPALPIALDTAVSKNRKRLENMAKNRSSGANPY